MGFYIKGMEIPASCFACPFRRKVDPDNIMCIVTREVFEETFAGTIETRNRGNCPLVPVPPHGRLGDLDALCDRLEKAADTTRYKEYIPGLTAAFSLVNVTPTIIEAEEGE